MKIKRFFLSFIIPAFLLLFVTAPALAADPYGLEATRSKTPFKDASNSLPETVGNIISVVLSLVGVIFLILALYAGFKWMTAGGNTKEVQSAKDIMINATAGIILIAMAYTITNFVFSDVISQL